MQHLQTADDLCQLVAADVQHREGFQGLQGGSHVCDGVVMKVEEGEVVHSFQVCNRHLRLTGKNGRNCSKLPETIKRYLLDPVVVYSQVFQASWEVCRDAGQVVVLKVQTF